jgi:hypothetical protein
MTTLVPDGGQRGVPDGMGARRGARWVPDKVKMGCPTGPRQGTKWDQMECPTGGQTGCPTGPDGVPNGARWSAQRGPDGGPYEGPNGVPNGSHVIGHVIFVCHVTHLGWQGVILLPILLSQR